MPILKFNIPDRAIEAAAKALNYQEQILKEEKDPLIVRDLIPNPVSKQDHICNELLAIIKNWASQGEAKIAFDDALRKAKDEILVTKEP